MRSILATETLRGIKGSLGRFLAIFCIVALGCGFFSSLRMTGPDMRQAADDFYDGCNLWDLRLISTAGFGDDDVSRVKAIDGVEAAMPSTSVDVMARLDGEQVAVRISSLDTEAARASKSSGAAAVLSDDDDYLNRPILRSGRWPEKAGECVVSADAAGAPLAEGDTIEALYGTRDLDGLLAEKDLKVVGTVTSPDYPYTGSFGSTTLGSGQIEQYVLVDPSTFVEGAPATEIYVKVSGAADYLSGSDAYQQRVDEVKQTVESQKDALATARLDDLRADAQEELDAKRKEYEDQRADAQSKLDDGASQLSAAEKKIASGESDLSSGRKRYEQGLAEYRQKKRQTEKQLADAQSELDARKKQASQGRAAFEQARDQVLAQTGASDLDAAAQAVDAQIAALSQNPEADQAAAGQLDQLRSTIATLKQQQASLDDADAKIAAGQHELDAKKAEAEKELASAKAKLDQTSKTLSSTASKLESGRRELASQRDSYNQQKADAQSQLADAESQLDDAQEQIDSLEVPSIYLLDRTQSEGAATYHADTERMDSIARVFPLIFFLVAALVALTTMTRMVEDERVQIGTYKALGYTTGQIASIYLVYAGIASVAGAAVGIFAMCQVLPQIIISSYGIIYTVPDLPFPLPVDPATALLSGGLGVGVTLGATWLAVVASLRESPADLMLPRAPQPGKRILLERVRPLWSRLSFSWKVTFRNIFRYKRRLAMCVIGIAGCTALLLTGFGLHDSIWDIIDCQYGPLIHYDTTVALKDSASDEDVDAVENYLTDEAGATNVVRLAQRNMRAGSASYDGSFHVQVSVPQTAGDLPKAVTLRDRRTHAPVAFDDDSVVLSEKTASLLGVGAGDEIRLYDQDDVGNARGDGHALTVTGITENYVGNLVYVGRDAWKSVFDDDPAFTCILCDTDDDPDVRQAVSDHLYAQDDVSTVSFSDETINRYRDMLSVVDLIVVVLIVSAAALAAVVLYNLTNINISERVREIASLKVLGFTRREVFAYIFRETFLLAILGDALGLILGIWLESFVVTTAEVDYVMFGRTIHPLSFVCAFALTLAFAAIIIFLMRRKLDRVDMVESLKSVD